MLASGSMITEELFLIIDRHRGCVRTLKNPPTAKLNRGEIVLKVILRVHDDAFREPTLVREIEVKDWQNGIPFGDVEFKQKWITEEEAAAIRDRRLDDLVETLRASGYEITPPPVAQTGEDDEQQAEAPP
jgi:hypothetical protein